MNVNWRTFKWAAWLGWQIESNWTRPALFATYSIVKPIASALILVFMLLLVTFAAAQPGQRHVLFDYLYIGNAFFIFVNNVLFGVFGVIQADREWYETMRYVYIAPISYYTYMAGRAAMQAVVASIAVTITLAFGVVFLGVQVDLGFPKTAYLLLAVFAGVACIVALGVCIGALGFLTAKHIHGFTEGIPGVFYLLCGVLFPLSVLPDWAAVVGKAIPLTYWFELVRRFLQPDAVFSDPSVQIGLQTSTAGVLALLAVTFVAFLALSVFTFRVTERAARRAGKIDQTTGY